MYCLRALQFAFPSFPACCNCWGKGGRSWQPPFCRAHEEPNSAHVHFGATCHVRPLRMSPVPVGQGLTELPSFSPLLLSVGPEQGDSRAVAVEELRLMLPNPAVGSLSSVVALASASQAQRRPSSRAREGRGKNHETQGRASPAPSPRSLSLHSSRAAHSARSSRPAAPRTRDQGQTRAGCRGGNHRGKRRFPVPPSAREPTCPSGRGARPKRGSAYSSAAGAVSGLLVPGQTW